MHPPPPGAIKRYYPTRSITQNDPENRLRFDRIQRGLSRFEGIFTKLGFCVSSRHSISFLIGTCHSSHAARRHCDHRAVRGRTGVAKAHLPVRLSPCSHFRHPLLTAWPAIVMWCRDNPAADPPETAPREEGMAGCHLRSLRWRTTVSVRVSHRILINAMHGRNSFRMALRGLNVATTRAASGRPQDNAHG